MVGNLKIFCYVGYKQVIRILPAYKLFANYRKAVVENYSHYAGW